MRAERAGAAGVIILDSRPRHQWRVSSPQVVTSYVRATKSNNVSLCLSQITSNLNTSIPIWSVDWIGVDLSRFHEDKIYVVWNIDSREQFEQLVSPLFDCDTSPNVRLEVEGGKTEDGCRFPALLNP